MLSMLGALSNVLQLHRDRGSKRLVQSSPLMQTTFFEEDAGPEQMCDAFVFRAAHTTYSRAAAGMQCFPPRRHSFTSRGGKLRDA